MSGKKLSVYLAIFCIGMAAIGVYSDLFYTVSTQNGFIIKDAFRLVSLGNLSTGQLFGYNGLNYANAAFNALLLLGSIFYLISSGRETRLFRAAFGVIFISKLLMLVSGILFLLLLNPLVPRTGNYYIISLLFALKHIALIYCAYRLLRYFNQLKAFDVEVHEHNGSTLSYSVVATKTQRITHTVLDTLIAFLVFAPVVETMSFLVFKQRPDYLENIGHGTFLAILLVCRIIYYLIFETIFASSPAKLMTETRVMDSEGNPPGFTRVLGRTFARLTPLEGLSFLAGTGWHDRWSGTDVVSEKPTGKSGSYYYLIPPVAIGIFTFYFFTMKDIKERGRLNDYKANMQQFKDDQLQKIDQAGVNDFLTLTLYSDFSNYRRGPANSKFLKVAQVKADSINFSIINVYANRYNEPGQMEAEQAYQANHDTLKHITLAKQDLKNALLPKGQNYGDQDATVKSIQFNNTKYAIKSISTFFQANIQLSNSFGYGNNYLNIGLENTGWPADVVKIDVLEGGAVISTHVPLRLSARSTGQVIEGTVDGNDVDFKVNITVRDTTGRTMAYQISGNSRENSNRFIKRLK